VFFGQLFKPTVRTGSEIFTRTDWESLQRGARQVGYYTLDRTYLSRTHLHLYLPSSGCHHEGHNRLARRKDRDNLRPYRDDVLEIAPEMSENYIDHAPFLSDRFDVNAYANAVLAGRSYRPDDLPDTEDMDANGSKAVRADAAGAQGDIGMELAKLNHGIVSTFSVCLPETTRLCLVAEMPVARTS
jgi:hypothetical protein